MFEEYNKLDTFVKVIQTNEKDTVKETLEVTQKDTEIDDVKDGKGEEMAEN